MKPVVLVPLLAAIAACGGGGGGSAESAKPTIVECMTPKAGVKFEIETWPKQSQPSIFDRRYYEVLANVFDGKPALTTRTYGVDVAGTRFFEYAESVYATGTGLNLLGIEVYDSERKISRRDVFSPPVTTPAALSIGLPVVREYKGTTTHPGAAAGGMDEVRTFSWQDKIELLGYEDITVADGHKLTNVCKVKVQVSEGIYPFVYEWYAAGYGRVAWGGDVDGKSQMRELISRIEQAP